LIYNPGSLDTACKFYRFGLSEQDSFGQQTETWALVQGAPTWCGFTPLRGSERWQAKQKTDQQLAKVIIRRSTSVDAKCEIEIRGERFAIVSFEDYGREGYMLLIVERKT
jgi:SPP1 family predicted phage head-tail adaptor